MDRLLAIKKSVVPAGDKLSTADLLADHPEVSKKIKDKVKKAVLAVGHLVAEIVSQEKGQETLPEPENPDEN